MDTTNTSAVDATAIAPIGHREGTALADVEYHRFAEALARLGPDDWARPTDCVGWSVRDMAGHLLGAMRAAASMREMLRQQRMIAARVKAEGGNETDHMTAVQIEATAALTPSEIVSECRRLATPAARGRRRTPAPLRRLVKFPVEIGTISETWTLGYLVDVILTRDTWMHRIDLARATGTELELDGDHDGRIVADIVGEWERRHGRPFDLVLGGAAGGHYVVAGADPERVELDAVEFCRILAGRAESTGLLAQEVPF